MIDHYIKPLCLPSSDELLRDIREAELAIYRVCGLRPSGKPKLRLIRGGRYHEPHQPELSKG